MCGNADGAATVTAHASGGTPATNRGSFASTGAARSAREIPGVAGLAGQRVVGFIRHEKFGRAGVADDNGAAGFQSSNKRRVVARNIVFAKARANGTRPTGYVDTAFDGEWHAMERANGSSA